MRSTTALAISSLNVDEFSIETSSKEEPLQQTIARQTPDLVPKKRKREESDFMDTMRETKDERRLRKQREYANATRNRKKAEQEQLKHHSEYQADVIAIQTRKIAVLQRKAEILQTLNSSFERWYSLAGHRINTKQLAHYALDDDDSSLDSYQQLRPFFGPSDQL